MSEELELGAVVDNPDNFHISLEGFDGISMNGYISLPETATLKDIKDFQEQAESMLKELKDASFPTSNA